MTYANNIAGRVTDKPSEVGMGDFWTFAAVEERLIETMRLWRRSPGGGKWPFASDAPWQLMTRRTRIEAGGLKGRELQLHMQAEDAEETRRWQGVERAGPLSRDDVARRDETTEWLTWVAEDSRRIVVLALIERAAGRKRTDWARIKRAVGVEVGNKGVYRRYTRAITGIAKRLNGDFTKADA